MINILAILDTERTGPAERPTPPVAGDIDVVVQEGLQSCSEPIEPRLSQGQIWIRRTNIQGERSWSPQRIYAPVILPATVYMNVESMREEGALMYRALHTKQTEPRQVQGSRSEVSWVHSCLYPGRVARRTHKLQAPVLIFGLRSLPNRQSIPRVINRNGVSPMVTHVRLRMAHNITGCYTFTRCINKCIRS